MRNLRELAIRALSVAVACMLSWQACAQAPTSDTTARRQSGGGELQYDAGHAAGSS